MKKTILIAISLLLISLVVGCAVKKEVGKSTTPTEQPTTKQDTAATMDKDLEQIDTELGDTTSIDSGLDDLDKDLDTI